MSDHSSLLQQFPEIFMQISKKMPAQPVSDQCFVDKQLECFSDVMTLQGLIQVSGCVHETDAVPFRQMGQTVLQLPRPGASSYRSWSCVKRYHAIVMYLPISIPHHIDCRIYFRRLPIVVYLVRVRLYSVAHSCLYLAVRFSLRLCLSVNQLNRFQPVFSLN